MLVRYPDSGVHRLKRLACGALCFCTASIQCHNPLSACRYDTNGSNERLLLALVTLREGRSELLTRMVGPEKMY